MNRQIQIETCYAGHNRCFVCLRKQSSDRRLRVVFQDSISYALVRYNILIPVGVRACKRHFVNDKLKDQEYRKIPTRTELVDARIIKSMISSSKLNLQCIRNDEEIANKPKYEPLFEPFRNVATLTDDYCREITGWSKIDFIRFSKYIKNLERDTKNRTKDMMIAMYRYWLKKAIDQKTLSYLKLELFQIRKNISENFTPHFLGFAGKRRDFFPEHNTPTVMLLYSFVKADNRLVFLLDGGYQNHEKSKNNEFQAKTFSVQKGHNLLKTFIITCSDGYICEAYTDFEATLNDDKILRHILQTDRHLRGILEANDFFFLDRGFRDTVTLLQEEYALNVVIPIILARTVWITMLMKMSQDLKEKTKHFPVHSLLKHVNVRKFGQW
jgi:hypothetical protein